VGESMNPGDMIHDTEEGVETMRAMQELWDFCCFVGQCAFVLALFGAALLCPLYCNSPPVM